MPFTWSQAGVQKERDNEVQEVEFDTEITFSSHRVNFLLSLVAWVMKTQRKLSHSKCLILNLFGCLLLPHVSESSLYICLTTRFGPEHSPSTPFCCPSCWPMHCWTVFWHTLEQLRGCCHLCQHLVFPRGCYCTWIMEIPNYFQTHPYDIRTEMAAKNTTLPPNTTQATPPLSLPLPARSVLVQA